MLGGVLRRVKRYSRTAALFMTGPQLDIRGVVLTFRFLTYARVTVKWASASKRTPFDKRDY